MKCLWEKISWAVASVLVSFLCVYIINPEAISSQQIVRSIEDLSLAHGEGYVQEGNCFKNETENAYFVYDLGEGTEKYEAIDLFFDFQGETGQQSIPIDLYHSSEGSEVDKVLVKGELTAGESKAQFVDDFQADRFIRIYVHAPIGQIYTITSIAIEGDAINLNIVSISLILLGSVMIYFVGRKFDIFKLLFEFFKWLWGKYDQTLDKAFYSGRKYLANHDSKEVKRLQFLICICSQAAILLWTIGTNRLLYATNDDTTMVAIAGGGYVAPSEYIVNMHIVIGYLLKALFTILPGINWVTVFYLMVYIVSFVCIDLVIIDKRGVNEFQFVGRTVVADVCFALLIGHFTFTVVAYTAAAAGTMAVVHSFEKSEKKVSTYHIWGMLLLLLAALVRAETLKTILLMLIPLSIYELVCGNIRYLVLEFAMAVIMVMSLNSNFRMMNQNPVEEEFLNWGELRSEALDCAVIPYNATVFDNAGISEEEYNACYNAFYYIKEAVSEEKMQSLIQLNNIRNKYNFDLMGFIIEHFNYITGFDSYKAICKWIFVLLFLVNMIWGKKEIKNRILLIWLAVVGVEFLYYFINRPLYRVVMPTYIIGNILIINIGKYDSSKLERIWKSKVNYKKLYIFACMIFSIICAGMGMRVEEYETAAYSAERYKVLDYMERNSDKLFLAGDPAVFSIGVCDSVWDYAGKDCNWNLIGNWEIYSVPSNNIMKEYGYGDFANIAQYAVNNDDMLFITTYSLSFVERGSYILDLYERYYGIRPWFEKVEDICTNKIGDSVREDWGVYRLVYSIGEQR